MPKVSAVFMNMLIKTCASILIQSINLDAFNIMNSVLTANARNITHSHDRTKSPLTSHFAQTGNCVETEDGSIPSLKRTFALKWALGSNKGKSAMD